MDLVSEWMACAPTIDPELCVDNDQVRPRVNDLGGRETCLELEQPCLTPPPKQRAEVDLGSSLKGDEDRPTEDQRLVPSGQLRSGDKRCAVDIGVDDGRAPPSAFCHE